MAAQLSVAGNHLFSLLSQLAGSPVDLEKICPSKHQDFSAGTETGPTSQQKLLARTFAVRLIQPAPPSLQLPDWNILIEFLNQGNCFWVAGKEDYLILFC